LKYVQVWIKCKNESEINEKLAGKRAINMLFLSSNIETCLKKSMQIITKILKTKETCKQMHNFYVTKIWRVKRPETECRGQKLAKFCCQQLLLNFYVATTTRLYLFI